MAARFRADLLSTGIVDWSCPKQLQRICFAIAALMITAATAIAGSHAKPKQAMFKTQAEAQAAAPSFGCTGAHQMGEMWMVCDKHGEADHHGAH